MAAVIRSSLRAIGPKLKAQLVAETRCGADSIFWIASGSQIPNFTAPADIILQVRQFTPYQPAVEGGGRWDTRITRIIDITGRVQLAVDPAFKDDEWLFGDNGYLALEEEIVAALQIFTPVDSSQNALLAEPCRFVQGQSPFKEQGNEVLWGHGTIGLEVYYTLDMDTTADL